MIRWAKLGNSPPLAQTCSPTDRRSNFSMPTPPSCSSSPPEATRSWGPCSSSIPGLARRGALRAQIEAVRVHESYRSQGLGTAMFEWAIAEARRRGCTLVQLTTDKTRTDAHRFYNRLGFVASHEGLKMRL